MYRLAILMMSAATLAGVLAGCEHGPSKIATQETPIVPVSLPKKGPVRDYVDYTGRTNAMDSVTIQPRVTGYLMKMEKPFKADVKKDDLLFVIDPRPYQAQLEAAKAQVAQNEASLRYAVATNLRYKELAKNEKGAVSARQLDQYQAQEEQAIANLNLAKANLVSAELNHKWTEVRSPISGHISRYYLTPGNLVIQDVTQLTTLVSMDPMYVYFDMDEPTLLQLKRAVNEGTIKAPKEGTVLPVKMGLAGEDGYPHDGNINFVDNQVNPGTGSISVRGSFPNTKPEGGTYLLLPGMFVRVRLPIGEETQQLMVIDRAITSDQGLKYVYVVDSDNKVEARRVTVGSLQEDGLRVITQGLKEDDRVLIGGLQQVRPRMVIQPEPVTMPSLVAPATIQNAAKTKKQVDKTQQGNPKQK